MRPGPLLALAGALLAAPPAAAQDPAPLGDVLDSLAALWARGDATGIAELSAAGGVDFEVEGETVGTITGRKLSASLRRVFYDRVTVADSPDLRFSAGDQILQKLRHVRDVDLRAPGPCDERVFDDVQPFAQGGVEPVGIAAGDSHW